MPGESDKVGNYSAGDALLSGRSGLALGCRSGPGGYWLWRPRFGSLALNIYERTNSIRDLAALVADRRRVIRVFVEGFRGRKMEELGFGADRPSRANRMLLNAE